LTGPSSGRRSSTTCASARPPRVFEITVEEGAPIAAKTLGRPPTGIFSGSTVGRLKIIRGYALARGIRWQFRRVTLPAYAVVSTRIGDRVLNREEMTREFSEAAIVSVRPLWLMAISLVVILNIRPATTGVADAILEVASAQGNVGLSSGITGPDVSAVAEAMVVLNRWIGRLVIISVLAYARSINWGASTPSSARTPP